MPRHVVINIILLGFISALTLTLILAPENDDIKNPLPILSRINIENVDYIKIHRKEDNLEFNKIGQDWYMQSPYQHKANLGRIDAILNLANAEVYDRFNMADIEREQFLPSQPSFIIQLQDDYFELGKTEPIDERRYVQFEDAIYLIDDIYINLNEDASAYLDLQLLPEISRIEEIIFPDYKLVLAQNDKWEFISDDESMHPSDRPIEEIIDSWRHTKALIITPYPEDDRVRDQVIQIKIANQTAPIVFDIVQADSALTLGRSDLGAQYHLTSIEAKELFIHLSTAGEQSSVKTP